MSSSQTVLFKVQVRQLKRHFQHSHIPGELFWARAQDVPPLPCLAGMWCQGMRGLRVATVPLTSSAKDSTLRLETHSGLQHTELD